ncbi:MAG TPA: nitrile hydratase accessory protein [Roseomonas sp.]|nr:nitrile hydratase accessory protein [Roseomonas sp.]
MKPLNGLAAALEPVAPLPRGEESGPVFREPWEASAFAMVVALHQRGLFTWGEWAECLGSTIRAAQAAGDPDHGDTYYRHWLSALEALLARKGIAGAEQLAQRQAAWDRAAHATPHGQPILLENDPLARPGAPG